MSRHIILILHKSLDDARAKGGCKTTDGTQYPGETKSFRGGFKPYEKILTLEDQGNQAFFRSLIHGALQHRGDSQEAAEEGLLLQSSFRHEQQNL